MEGPPRWVPHALRSPPMARSVQTGTDNRAAWNGFWSGLHHQGDVGEASYATIPHLVEIYSRLGIFDWNAYAIVAIVELCREQRNNPPLPKWLEKDYFHAIQ